MKYMYPIWVYPVDNDIAEEYSNYRQFYQLRGDRLTILETIFDKCRISGWSGM